ncbi:hypothetical protein HAALTHF_38780n [Vreelandella aquamarina]|nr:hypothetical protein HAALTHF_38780n [Halomonas axialensis]
MGPVNADPAIGVGIYLQIGLKLMPIRKLGMGFKLMWQGRDAKPSDKTSAKPSDEGGNFSL